MLWHANTAGSELWMRVSTSRFVVAMLSVLLLAAGPPAVGLAQQLDTTVSRALSRIQDSSTQSMGFVIIERVLRAQGSALERANAEILADSMVAMVLDTVSHGLNWKTRSLIIFTLGYSASETARSPAFEAAKYRLARIAFEAQAARDRSSAVYQLTTIPDSQFALDILKRIALSDDDDTSYWAVVRLRDGMGDKGGIAVLKELWDSGGVKGPRARTRMSYMARRYGWK